MAVFPSNFDYFVANSVQLDPTTRACPGTGPEFPDFQFRFVPWMNVVPKPFILDDWLAIP